MAETSAELEEPVVDFIDTPKTPHELEAFKLERQQVVEKWRKKAEKDKDMEIAEFPNFLVAFEDISRIRQRNPQWLETNPRAYGQFLQDHLEITSQRFNLPKEHFFMVARVKGKKNLFEFFAGGHYSGGFESHFDMDPDKFTGYARIYADSRRGEQGFAKNLPSYYPIAYHEVFGHGFVEGQTYGDTQRERPPVFLVEGLAEYVSQQLQGVNSHDTYARDLVRIFTRDLETKKPEKIWELSGWSGGMKLKDVVNLSRETKKGPYDIDTFSWLSIYAKGASFHQFLADRIGVEGIKDLHNETNKTNVLEKVAERLGKPIQQLEGEWLQEIIDHLRENPLITEDRYKKNAVKLAEMLGEKVREPQAPVT